MSEIAMTTKIHFKLTMVAETEPVLVLCGHITGADVDEIAMETKLWLHFTIIMWKHRVISSLICAAFIFV